MSTTPSTDNPADLAPILPRSAAREVWMCRDIRKQYLQLLGAPDLARCVGVTREGAWDVAGPLYHSVESKTVLSFRESSEDRHKAYRSAVVELRTSNANIIGRLKGALDLLPDDGDANVPPHPDAFNRLTLFLRQAFPSLRRLVCHEYAAFLPETWTIHFDPYQVPVDESDHSFGPSPEHPLHIDVIQTREACVEREPKGALNSPFKPSDAVRVNYRCDVDAGAIDGQDSYVQVHSGWLGAIREGRCFDRIYKALRIKHLPISIDDLALLYRRQDSAGFADRLETIIVPHISSFAINQFESFARIASSSLTTLVLARPYPHAGVAWRTDFTFSDLPKVLTIVETHLPKVVHLELAVSGVRDAEEVFQSWLAEDTLDHEGQLQVLHIHTEHTIGPLFTALRSLSRWTAIDAEVTLSSVIYGEWPAEMQTKYLRHLKALSPERRRYMSTVDFASLEVTVPTQVFELKYDDDDRPRRRLQTKADVWSCWAVELGELTRDELVPNIEEELADFEEATCHFAQVANYASPSEMLEEMAKLRAVVKNAKAKAEKLQIILNTISSVGSDLKQLSWMLDPKAKARGASQEWWEWESEDENSKERETAEGNGSEGDSGEE